jgi:hypothetical protein
VIEGLRLVETAHFYRPLDGLAAAAEAQYAVFLPRDRNDAQIDRGRKHAVDVEFRFASSLALRQRGEIEKRIAQRALDLEHAVAGQEHRRRMGVDAHDRRAAKTRGVIIRRDWRISSMGLSIVRRVGNGGRGVEVWRRKCSAFAHAVRRN